MYIIPTRGRPGNLTRLLTHARPKERGLVILDDDDAPNYSYEGLPTNWQIMIWPRARVGEHLNRAFQMFPFEPWYALGADDLLPTPGWDAELAELITPTGIIWPYDGMKGNCTHPVIGGELVRCAGWLAAPGLKHFYVDNVWHELSKALGCKGLVQGINVNHLHWSDGRAAYDETYKNRPPVESDRIAFKAFMADQFPQLVEKMKCLT